MNIFEVIEWNVGPEIFRIGNFSLLWYPLMFVISFLVGVQIMTYIYKRENKNLEELDSLLLVMIFGAIIGARLGHYIFYDWQLIFQNPIEVLLPIEFTENGVKFVGYRGLASHGAVFSILALLYWFSKKYKHNYFWLVDRLVIPVAFAAILIRIGNFFNHEIVGEVAYNLPWAVQFKYHSDQLPRHPTQLYESFCYLITFITLFTMYRKGGKFIPYGKLFGLFMMMVFGARFCIEFFKEEQNLNDLGVFNQIGLNIGQLLSIPMILVGIYFYFIYSRSKGKQDMEREVQPQSQQSQNLKGVVA